MKGLRHRNVVQLYTYSSDPKTHIFCIVMEYCKHKSLSDILAHLSNDKPTYLSKYVFFLILYRVFYIILLVLY